MAATFFGMTQTLLAKIWPQFQLLTGAPVPFSKVKKIKIKLLSLNAQQFRLILIITSFSFERFVRRGCKDYFLKNTETT